MTVDLKNMTRKELEKLQKDIDKALVKIVETERRAALAAAEKAAKAHGFSLAELSGVKPVKTAAKPAKPVKKDKRAKVAPKYRNPADATATWTGRGRRPKWVEAHLNAGGSLDDITI